MSRTKIVATIGPASASPAMLKKLILAGVDVCRLNFSHGDHASHEAAIRDIRAVSAKLRAHTAILMDLQGPRIRVGHLEGGAIVLRPGAAVVLTTRAIRGTAERFATTYKRLAGDVKPGNRILLDDGLLELRVESVSGADVACRVVKGGPLKEHKGMNLPGVDISARGLTAKDIADLRFGLGLGVDYVAMSFVRGADDIHDLKKRIREAGFDAPVIAKIERAEAVERLDEILREADGVMVARGDLGVELEPERVPPIQKEIIQAANRAGRIVITATQMLESMVANPRPTRAEASDVANAVFDGTDAVMLSAETSAGKYPVESVLMMDRIATEAERVMRPVATARENGAPADIDFSEAVARAAVISARDVNAAAIIPFSFSGATARLVSKYRPPCPILGAAPSEAVARRMALLWGVQPAVFDHIKDLNNLVGIVDRALRKMKLVRPNDTVILTAGHPVGKPGRSNLMKIHRVGHVD